MKIKIKRFFGGADVPLYEYTRLEREKRFKKQNMCVNCRLMIYNRLNKDDQFCAHFLTPVKYYEICAYFKFRWEKQLV